MTYREWKIENKSIQSGKKSVLLSSISAWKKEMLPKFLIVWEINKKMAKIEGRNGRDVEGEVVAYHIYYIDEELNIMWENNPMTHSELIKQKWNNEIDEELVNEISRLHKKFPDKIIRFQKSFKNGNNVRLQYQISDYRKLPTVPAKIKKKGQYKSIVKTCEQMLGSKLKVKKFELPYLQGNRVWLSEKILQMEHEQKKTFENMGFSKSNATKKAKDIGELYLITKENSIIKLPGNFSAREDYWIGNAIDILMSYFNDKLTIPKSNKEVGVDLFMKIVKEKDLEEKMKMARKMGKHNIMREIQKILNIEPSDSDISRGSTVTTISLWKILEALIENENK
jgi:hypothetical protein